MLVLLLATLLQDQPNAKALAADALVHLRAERAELLNYTFTDTEHDVTHGGIFPSHHTTVAETIALEGSQYTRRIQRDGKPLSGKDLEHETQLYERAIQERRSVSEVQAERKEITLHKLPNLQSRLLTDFEIRVTGTEEVDGSPCTVLVFDPLPGEQPAATSRFTWWVDSATHEIRRETRLVVAQEGTMLPGSVFTTHSTAINGVLLPHDSHIEASWLEPGMKNRKIRVIAEHQMTNYRRFRSTARVVPSDEPEGPAQP